MRPRRGAVAGPWGASTPATVAVVAVVGLLLAACGRYDSDEAQAMTCQEFGELNPDDVFNASDGQEAVIQALLRSQGADDGPVNVQIAHANLMITCGLGMTGSVGNPSATLGSLAQEWDVE